MTVDAIADACAAVPQTVDRGLQVGREYRPPGRHAVGQRMHGVGGNHIAGLVRIQAEHGAPHECRGTLLHDTDIDVAILDRGRELAHLKRCAHALILADRDLTAEYQRLAAPADTAVEGANQHLPGTWPGQGLLAQGALTGRRHPVRVCLVCGHGFLSASVALPCAPGPQLGS